jgi:hypothetical protein
LATIWSSLEKIHGAKILWRTALDPEYETLEKQSTSDAAAGRIKAALAALEKLPWDGDVKNFRAGGSVEQLALWFTTDWLNPTRRIRCSNFSPWNLGSATEAQAASRQHFLRKN